MAYLYGYMAEFMDMATGALRLLLFSTWWWGVLARYAGVRAVAFWVGALIAMSIYMAECLCCSGSICAGALMLIFGGLLVHDLW